MKNVRWNSKVPVLIVCAITALTYMMASPFCWGNTESEIQLENETNERAPLFLKDIAPILDKQGCSAGLCHGKFGGARWLKFILAYSQS